MSSFNRHSKLCRSWFAGAAALLFIAVVLTAYSYRFYSHHEATYTQPQAFPPRHARPPSLPARAFLITTEARHSSNWTSYVLAQVMRHKRALNISQIDIVFTSYMNEFGPIANPGHRDLGAACSVTHKRVWDRMIREGLDSAWVFEDDVVFHDDFDTLLPIYWQGVPRSYEFAFVGHSPMGDNLVACQVSSSDILADNEVDTRVKVHPTKLLQVSQFDAECPGVRSHLPRSISIFFSRQHNS